MVNFDHLNSGDKDMIICMWLETEDLLKGVFLLQWKINLTNFQVKMSKYFM